MNRQLVKIQCGYLHIAHGYRTPVQAEVEYCGDYASHKNAA